MNRKLKLAVLAALGFSTACSTVRSGNNKPSGDADSVRQSTEQPRIIAMYGVRPAVPYDEAMRNKDRDTVKKEQPAVTPPAENSGK